MIIGFDPGYDHDPEFSKVKYGFFISQQIWPDGRETKSKYIDWTQNLKCCHRVWSLTWPEQVRLPLPGWLQMLESHRLIIFWWFNNKTQMHEYHNIDQDWTLGCWRIGWFHRLLFSYIRHISKPLMSCFRSAWYWTHMPGCGYSFWYSFGIQLNWLPMMGRWRCFQMLRIYLLVKLWTLSNVISFSNQTIL